MRTRRTGAWVEVLRPARRAFHLPPVLPVGAVVVGDLGEELLVRDDGSVAVLVLEGAPSPSAAADPCAGWARS